LPPFERKPKPSPTVSQKSKKNGARYRKKPCWKELKSIVLIVFSFFNFLKEYSYVSLVASLTHVCALSDDGDFLACEGMAKVTGKISKWLTLVSLKIDRQYVI
jgi:hypothetical protein